MRVGKTMTVGVWKGDWLAFGDDARFDIDRTVRNLKAAEQIADDAAKVLLDPLRARSSKILGLN